MGDEKREFPLFLWDIKSLMIMRRQHPLPFGKLLHHRAAVLMLRGGEDAAQGWEGEYKPGFDRKNGASVSVAQWNSALDF